MTFIVCGSVGLDVSGESIPCVAGSGEGGVLEAVNEFASLIDSLARRIESALDASDIDDDAPRRKAVGATQPS